MYTVKEISRTAGVSVRTLHHYDSIGLLRPTEHTRSGYRLYDSGALRRLYTILMFRQLRFSLKEIKTMLDNPDFDFGEALEQQIKLLQMQRNRLDELITIANEMKSKGEYEMKFDVFDSSEFENYKEEVKERWGETEAYREYEEKTGEKSREELNDSGDALMRIFAQAGELRGQGPGSDAVQEKVRQLQSFITENYYTCTDEILRGLGQMYVCDERMKKNIDAAGGEGTAELVSEAIKIYCR